MSQENPDIIDQQIAYYRARAPEYDDWFFRRGRYDRGEENNRRWFAEVDALRKALADFHPRGQVVELAAGTGLWTEQLVRWADSVTAVDSSPETLSLNEARVAENVRKVPVVFKTQDIFQWNPRERYDVVFFAFWLSHVPPDKFDAFWELVRSCLAPKGRVFFIDSLYTELSTAMDHKLEGQDSTTVVRKLSDGSTHRVVKVFYEPSDLEGKLRARGWNARVGTSGQFFLNGQGTPA